MADLKDEREEPETHLATSMADYRAAGEETANEGQAVTFEEGFTIRSMMGALFVAFIMLPGGLYLGLVAGQGLGAAAEWVTILLFSEVARRSFAPLKRQEIYLLFLMASSLTGLGGNGLSGGPFAGFIWNVYFRGSSAARAFGLTNKIPNWVVPPPDSPAILHRTFWSPAWAWPIGLLVFFNILGLFNTYGLGYVLFRLTSDIERLPFPMAAVNAGGATALAEAGTKGESWRWRAFSIGAMIGIIFGFFYVAVPIFTGAVLLQPIQIIPIPFLDLTQNTEHFLPGAQMGIDLSLGTVFSGFIIPYPVVIGGAIATLLSQFVAAPILQTHGYFPMWRPGMSAIYTGMVTGLDFWMSVGIGTGVAIGLIGIYSVFQGVAQARAQGRVRTQATGLRTAPPPGRGDIPIWLALAFWFLTTCATVAMSHYLVPGFPLWILLAFAFVYTPLISYVSARLIGLTTRGVGFPFIKEATIIKSGYKKLDIWYAPFPMGDYGGSAQWFREVELTGTKFTSLLKMNMFMTPLVLIASFVYWSFFWRTNVIPSAQFPFAQKYWPLNATTEAIWKTANLAGGQNFFMKAIKPRVIYESGGGAIVLYVLSVVFKIPVLYYYGFINGIGGAPMGTFGQLFGALMGRYYFAKRMGAETWQKVMPVLLAGFACGGGLIGMAAIALALIVKVTNFLPF